ncbi:MAG: ShlB/FhaC/HecB family hemolysin secretion/activation protein [Planctomycetaceae bacterium]
MNRIAAFPGQRSKLATAGLSLLVVAVVVTRSTSASAQDFDRYRPRTPFGGVVTPGLPTPPYNPIDGSTDVLVNELKGIMILDHESRVQDPIKPFDDVRIDPAADLTVAREDNFKDILTPYLGQPITIRLLNEMASNIVMVYRDAGQPVVDVNMPSGQDITDGIVQVVITEAKIGSVRFRGNCHFSDCLLQQQTWLRPGQNIYVPSLQDELIWFNHSPYRTVGLSLEPGTDAGTTNIVFDVNDRRPLNGYLGYEDSGTRRTSLERVVAGFSAGNLFGQDGQLAYQWMADAALSNQIGVHSLIYRAPIFENRDSWSLAAQLQDIDTVAATAGAISDANAWQISARYHHPLCETQCRNDIFHFGFDVKGTQTDLDFGGVTVLPTDVQVVQLMAGISSEQIYDDGHTLYGADLFLSPGYLSGRNDDGDFSRLRPGARSTYAYTRGYIERLYAMDQRSDLVLRATGQLSTYKLLQTEQLSFGGYNSIRGYDMRAASGDSGYILNAELRTKPIQHCVGGMDSALTMLAFTDFGQYVNWNNVNNGVAPEHDDILASVGVGMRYVMDPTVTLRFDYGVPLTTPSGVLPQAAPSSGRIHLGAILAF